MSRHYRLTLGFERRLGSLGKQGSIGFVLSRKVPADAAGDPCRSVLDRISRQVSVRRSGLDLRVASSLRVAHHSQWRATYLHISFLYQRVMESQTATSIKCRSRWLRAPETKFLQYLQSIVPKARLGRDGFLRVQVPYGCHLKSHLRHFVKPRRNDLCVSRPIERGALIASFPLCSVLIHEDRNSAAVRAASAGIDSAACVV